MSEVSDEALRQLREKLAHPRRRLWSGTMIGEVCEECDVAIRELLTLRAAERATADKQISYGPPRQNYPGGPIYRIGTSRGVTCDSAVRTAKLNIKHEQQPNTAGPVAELLHRKPSTIIDDGYSAEHPSVAAAVALAVEKCAKIADTQPDTLESVGKPGSGCFRPRSKVAEQIRALSTALTAEAEAMREDAARYRWLRSGSAIVEAVEQKRTAKEPFCIIPTATASFPLYGDELDAAIDAARGKP